MAFDLTDREALAWAAGFYDGEGCTGLAVQSARSAALMLQVSQNDRAPLERFQESVGGLGRIYPRSSGASWAWQTTRTADAIAVVALLWGWLSPPKRHQIKDKLTRLRDYPFQGSLGGTHCVRGHRRTVENTYTWRGQKSCRACRRVNSKRPRASERS